MNDEKRQLRVLKRELKRAGNRQRRRFLKNLTAAAEDFDFGRLRTEPMNEPRPPKERRPERKLRAELEA